MSSGAEVSYAEVPVFFDTSEARLFGIVTLPTDEPAHTGLVVLPGAGATFTVNRNRLSVRLARALAPMGYAVLRLDYHGVGESTGTIVERFHLNRPFADDVVAGVGALREMGVRPVILAGSCFGGRCALTAAARLDDVEAVVLLATSVRDYAQGEGRRSDAAARWGMGRFVREALRPRRMRRLLDPQARRSYRRYAGAKLRSVGHRARPADLVSPVFEQPFRTLLDRRVPILQLFGEEDRSLAEYLEAASGPLADALGRAGDLVDVRTVPGEVNGFLTPPIQDAVIDAIAAWAGERRPGDRAPVAVDEAAP
jgi:pimeloyl-ACP methyl ester carboxylesterase